MRKDTTVTVHSIHDAHDDLVPDPVIMKEFDLTAMKLWRWDHNPEIGFPPKIKIGARNYRSRRAIEAFKAELLRRAIENQHRIYDRVLKRKSA
jgi:hypothetical protein